MPYPSQTSNIPGMQLQFKDGGLDLRSQIVTPNTRSILVLGTAVDGPVMQAAAVDGTTAEQIYGKSIEANGRPNGATIPEAISQFWKAGCRDIRVMRISGSVASAKITAPSENDTTTEIANESLGKITGNTENVFSLSHKLIDATTVVVKANGIIIDSNLYTANIEAGTVTLAANAVTAGSEIVVSYRYFPLTTEVTETNTIEDSLAVVALSHRPLISSSPAVAIPTITINDIAQSGFSINPVNKLTTFSNIIRAGSETFVGSDVVGSKVFEVTDNTVVSISSITIDGTATTDYTRDGNVITFGTAPADAAIIVVNYTYYETTLSDPEVELMQTNTSDALTFNAGTDVLEIVLYPNYPDKVTDAITLTPDDWTIEGTRETGFIIHLGGANPPTLTMCDVNKQHDVTTVVDAHQDFVGNSIAGETEFELVDHTPVSNIVVSVDDVVKTLGTDYTVNGNVITFTVAPAKDADITISYRYNSTALISGDVVSITYNYASGTTIAVTENRTSTGSPIWIAEAATTQDFVLEHTPVADTMKLYIDGREIVSSTGYIVDTDTNTLQIDKNTAGFAKDSTLVVRYEYNNTSSIIPEIAFETIYGGKLYNEATIEIKVLANDIRQIIITKPLAKRSSSNEVPLVYFSSEYPTFGQLVDAINRDSANGVFTAYVEPEDEDKLTSNLIAQEATRFTGGDDGLNLSKQELFEKLSGKKVNGVLVENGAYQLLANYAVDIVVPRGVYADDVLVGKNDNFAYELAKFCGESSLTHLTHGVIALKPPKKKDLASIEAWVKNAESYTNNFFLMNPDGSVIIANGEPFDLGGYISVIAGPELTLTSTRLGRYNDNGCCQYGALLSILKSSSAPTNKKLPSVVGLSYILSVPQLNRLAAKRYVTFQTRISDGAVCPTDGVTVAQKGSDYSRVVITQVLRDLIAQIYKVSEPYIGEPLSSVTNNALTSAINKILLTASDPQGGDISDYDFQIVYNQQDKLVGDSQLELTIVPLGERRKITVVVGLKPALS